MVEVQNTYATTDNTVDHPCILRLLVGAMSKDGTSYIVNKIIFFESQITLPRTCVARMSNGKGDKHCTEIDTQNS